VDVAHKLLLRALNTLSQHKRDEHKDCRWSKQVNHAVFNHVSWFLSMPLHGAVFPCSVDIRIFVSDHAALEQLHGHPLSCATKGLCFTEVWIHQYLINSACRVHSRSEADFEYVPVYGSCYDLDNPDAKQLSALKAFYAWNKRYRSRSTNSSIGIPQLLLVFSCEKWKMKAWRAQLRANAVIAAVEAQPLIHPSAVALSAKKDNSNASKERRLSWHCQECVNSSRDVIIPSAVLPADAERLKVFARDPDDRELLLCFHGYHANSTTRQDVADGYREVNETVRLAILEHLGGRAKVSVGGPALAYSVIMGKCHFCLIPRGRGWWTVPV